MVIHYRKQLFVHKEVCQLFLQCSLVSGTYQCVAKNDAGETELSFALEVLVAPQFTQFFHNPEIELLVGEELHLDCLATGNPKPQVSFPLLALHE